MWDENFSLAFLNKLVRIFSAQPIGALIRFEIPSLSCAKKTVRKRGKGGLGEV
jgi:hypothetical protein